MAMMSMGMDLLAQQQMRASPALIALNNMLVLSTNELQQLVQKELEENPALEQDEQAGAFCDSCSRALINGLCPACLQDSLRFNDHEFGSAMAASDDEFDPMLAVAAPMTLCESLQRDLHTAIDECDYPIADYLIGSLDQHGFLDCTLEEIVDALAVESARVEYVLQRLQEIGPPGVGARNVQECLLIQAERLDRAGISNPYLRRVISDYWDDFGNHRYTELARALGSSYEDVVAVRDFMRAYLRPFPLKPAEEERSAGGIAYLIPDVVIVDEGDRLVVDMVESRRFVLHLNPLYQELAQPSAPGNAEMSSDDHEHLSSFVTRARLFLTNLQQRRETIKRVCEYLIVRQEAYLRQGIRHLVPLTRAEVAAEIGVHESTVSRATANKFVQLPNREIVPFSHFFSASLSVKDVIQELIAGEETPLTDEQIVAILRQRGFNLARRTVAKYRGQLGILSSTVR